MPAAHDYGALHKGFEAYLRSELVAVAPGGVWLRYAPQQVTGVRVVWNVVGNVDAKTHDRAGHLEVVYSAVAWEQSTKATGVMAAADRILDLVSNRPDEETNRPAFPAAGLTVIRMELNPDNPSVIGTEVDGDRTWQFRGYVCNVLAAVSV
jgi:hypothetical protein